MNFQDLVTHYGSPQQISKALGVSKQLVSYWKRAGVPLGRQYEIQVLTGGRLRADPTSNTTRGSRREPWSKRTRAEVTKGCTPATTDRAVGT
jgi:hypothetical protein